MSTIARALGRFLAVGVLLAACLFPVRSASAVGLAPAGDIARVVAGSLHSCLLDRLGRVACWGDNGFGQLGLGETSALAARPTPVPVPGLAGIRAIATNASHTCVITAEKSVQCWGFNDSGQLGDGQFNTSNSSPVATLGLPGPVKAVSTGGRHSCALLEDGRVSCWGSNDHGQLGDGSQLDLRPQAGLVPALGATALLIEASGDHTCAALNDGSVRCWGANEFGQIGNNSTTDARTPVAVQGLPGPVQDFAGGAISSCALTNAGALYCWGSQFPLGAFDGGSLIARIYPEFETGIVAIDAGDFHICALRADDRVKCLGDNVDGQFGTGPLDGSLGADTTVGLTAGITRITAGGHHSCVVNAAGGAQCWGSNIAGQIGIDEISLRLVPTQVIGLTAGIAAVTVGNRSSCSLSALGAVKCWGYNRNGELGDGSTLTRLAPVDVIGLQSGVRAVESGSESSCVITSARRVKCWGANFDGRLGNNSTTDSTEPVDVIGLGEVDALAISIGRTHSCALLSGGAVKCWGTNEFGQLGDGTLIDRPTAVSVVGLGSGVRSISAGFYHTCAVTDAGAMRCWGINGGGQLGDGSTQNRSTPVGVVGLSSGVNQAAAGALHSCATLSDGSVSCWGASEFGTLLGDGSEVDRSVPGIVPALRSGVVEISAGYSNTCVRLASGPVLCWGRGVGDNTQLSRPFPTPVSGLSQGVGDVDAGVGSHTCAAVSGAARCWGENTFGQIGDGSTHGELTARTVLINELVRQVQPINGAANAASSVARFDASGRYVVFQSDADNLVSGDSNGGSDIFRRDRDTGDVMRISVDNSGAQLNGDSSEPSVSADGQFIVFVAPDAAASKLLGEGAKARKARMKGTSSGIFLRNLLTGSTQRVASAMPSGSSPVIAPGGGSVVFTGVTTDANQGAVGQINVFVVPLTQSGSIVVPGSASCVTCKSVSTAGVATTVNANADSRNAVVSADGAWVAYETGATNAISDSSAPCPVGNSQILLRNVLTGGTARISPPSSLPTSQCAAAGSQNPSIDYQGQTIAWQSDQSLASGDNNGVSDVYVWQAGQSGMMRVSVGGAGTDTAAAAQSPQVSGDGSEVVFVSSASNHDLGFPDNNDSADVHSVNLSDPTIVQRLSRTAIGGEINAASQAPTLNYDGSSVAFQTTASNLPSALVGQTSIYARSNPLANAKRTATWWIPQESGWGLTVFDQGSLLAPAWFTYDTDGEPTWFFISGAFTRPDGSYRGDVLRLRGVPFDQINGPATTSATTAGSVTLTFSGDSRLDFAYTVDGISQTKAMEKFPFGTRQFTCSTTPTTSRSQATNYTDIWSGAGVNAGWGLTLLHVDQLLAAAWYTYDSDGEAVFFIITSTLQADGSYVGNILRQRNGTPFSAINGMIASAGNDVIGTARFQFTNGETASFSYTINGTTQVRAINRLLVGSEGQQCRSTDAAGN